MHPGTYCKYILHWDKDLLLLVLLLIIVVVVVVVVINSIQNPSSVTSKDYYEKLSQIS